MARGGSVMDRKDYAQFVLRMGAAFLVFAVVIGGLLALFYWLPSLRSVPRLRVSLVHRLFELAGTAVQAQDGEETLAFSCTIIEETACWFETAEGALGARLPQDVVYDFLDQLGWESMVTGTEQGTLRVRCTRASRDAVPACFADGGWGEWVPLVVR